MKLSIGNIILCVKEGIAATVFHKNVKRYTKITTKIVIIICNLRSYSMDVATAYYFVADIRDESPN